MSDMQGKIFYMFLDSLAERLLAEITTIETVLVKAEQEGATFPHQSSNSQTNYAVLYGLDKMFLDIRQYAELVKGKSNE